jgi:hypothetical protein
MGKIYKDESHCLVGPEIRSDEDKLISCYCRDAIADANYVYSTYLLPGKDRNLEGTFLALQDHAQEMCGHDMLEAIESKDRNWNGPEVVRSYPPDSEIEKIAPVNGFRTVEYKVQLIYRDSQGHVTRTQNFLARDRLPVKQTSR